MRLSTLFISAPSLRMVGTTAMALGTIQFSGVFAQHRSSEAAEASIKDADAECAPYYYTPVAIKLSSFPTIWQPAQILPGDMNAQSKWDSTAFSVPNNISIKGTITGDFSNFTSTYSQSDSDWWTYHQCVTPKLPGLLPDIINIPEPNTLGYVFDDGSNCSHNAFYDYMNNQNRKLYSSLGVISWIGR